MIIQGLTARNQIRIQEGGRGQAEDGGVGFYAILGERVITMLLAKKGRRYRQTQKAGLSCANTPEDTPVKRLKLYLHLPKRRGLAGNGSTPPQSDE